MAKKKPPAEQVQHGLDGACYSGGPGEPYYQPCICCMCGWSCREATWEDAGVAFDEHLAESE